MQKAELAAAAAAALEKFQIPGCFNLKSDRTAVAATAVCYQLLLTHCYHIH
jgi:hypothetical protein